MRWARSTTSRRRWCPEVLRSKVRVFVELYRMNRQLQKRAAEREALARSEAARAAAEEAIHRADYLAEASQQLSRSLNIDDTIRAVLDLSRAHAGRAGRPGHPDKEGGVRWLEMHPSSGDGLRPSRRTAKRSTR
jgi:uncharacterized membrane protein YccC